MDNLEIYNKYRAVPGNALKPFDNGNFKGTDINSMWRIKCLTEQFGMVGFGWTTRVLKTWTELGANNEIMAFAEIEMKVCVDGKWSEPFTATGGNLMVRFVRGKNGNPDYYKNSDEAFKMAITDAFGVACKYLGIGADVYWENDKTKYNNEDTKVEPLTYETSLSLEITFGKHSGKTLSQIWKEDRDYIKWLLNNESTDARIKEAIGIISSEIAKKKAQKTEEKAS